MTGLRWCEVGGDRILTCDWNDHFRRWLGTVYADGTWRTVYQQTGSSGDVREAMRAVEKAVLP